MAALGVERDQLGTPYGAKYRMDYAPRHVLRQVVYPYALLPDGSTSARTMNPSREAGMRRALGCCGCWSHTDSLATIRPTRKKRRLR
jgi:hypothetical protein